jgi:hypothetical protein
MILPRNNHVTIGDPECSTSRLNHGGDGGAGSHDEKAAGEWMENNSALICHALSLFTRNLTINPVLS